MVDLWPKTYLHEAYERISDEERRRSLLSTDLRQEDNPIIQANDAFIHLTGYSRKEVLERNCRFLQGKDTDQETVDALRKAIERRDELTVDILNYKKDGTPFWNRLRIRPILSGSSEIKYYVGIQNPIDPSVVRTKPLPGMWD